MAAEFGWRGGWKGSWVFDGHLFALDCMAVRRDRAKSLPCPPPALCACADWPALYDEQRLQENTVPVAAASYYDVSPRPAPLELHTLR